MSLDVRSLALFRMAIGAILVGDCLLRLRDFGLMFAPDGLFPLPLLRAWQNDPSAWSACFLHEARWWQAVVLAAEGLAGLALAVGLRTRLANAVAWAATVSVLRRTAPAANAGDVMMVTLLFWGLFLPLGAVWSLDARRRTGPRGAGMQAWAAPLILQIAAVYLGAGIAKCSGAWLSGSAVATALSVHDHGTPNGEWLASLPGLPRALTWGVLCLELAGPLLLVAVPSAGVRTGLVAAFWAFHLGIAAFMSVGLFAPIGLAAWASVLPTTAWDRMLGPPRRESAMIVAPPRSVRLVAWALLLLAGVIWLHESGPLQGRTPPRAIVVAGNIACIPQRWNMFGDVPNQRQWVQGRALLENGRVVDVLRGGRPIEDSWPQGGFATLPHHRWHKLFWELPKPSTRVFGPAVASAIARAWNAGHGVGERILSLDIRFGRMLMNDPSNSVHDLVVGTWPDRGSGGAGNLDRLLESLDAAREAHGPTGGGSAASDTDRR